MLLFFVQLPIHPVVYPPMDLSGSRVQRSETLPYYRTRTILVDVGSATVRLNHNPEATTTGVFHCEIPDASGDLQSLYVGIYNTTTGKSCTLKLKSNMFV